MVSIIIVHYNVKKELFDCIASIYNSKTKTQFEIIVVDNDEKKSIYTDLKKRFPQIKYIANYNRGFGQGNNVGAKKSKGDYLFFLNPDTKILPKSIDLLVHYLYKKKNVGIAAPLLIDDKNKLYPQGVNELTPVASVFSNSIFHKIFPNNPISRKYWMKDEWDRKSIHEVASIPGAAFVIRKQAFDQLNGFDEKIFMYFEEHDLCKRARTLGWKIVMLPQSKVYHALGRSSKQLSGINKIFRQSRFYYFKKHFGYVKALIVEICSRINKYTLILGGIILLAMFLLLYKLTQLMSFIGDHGWFYLSARDLLIKGDIPLVGIASSHPWLHQGPHWTYLLAVVLGISQFNPISGAYLSVLFGLAAILMIYKVGSLFFSSRVGVIASLLFATSPLVIIHARAPYHTAPIPFLTLLYLYTVFKWLQGNPYYFPVTVGVLALLYNFELATFLLIISFIIIIIFGLLKKKNWLLRTLTPKILLLTIASFIITMLPVLIYDLQHGFPQTLLFLIWIAYKVATLFGYPSLHPDVSHENYKTIFLFIADNYNRLIFFPSSLVSLTIAVFSFGFFYKDILDSIKTKKHHTGIYLLALVTLICILGIIATRTVSLAYLPVLYSPITLITALFFDKLIIIRPRLKIFIALILGIIVSANIFTIISKNYFDVKGAGLAEKLVIAEQIVKQSNGKKYNLEVSGSGSNFESFNDNYEYLTWWVGNAPSQTKQPLLFIIEGTPNGIELKKVGNQK